jgi:hypothetical protein
VRTAWLAFLLLGCATESRINPDERLDTLPEPERAQLCRYTSDVLGGADWSCATAPPPALTDFDACRAAPPWSGYATVGDWEECVNARAEDPCLEGAPCAP